MKILKIVCGILVLGFAGAGLMGWLSFDVTMPFMFLSLGIFQGILGIEAHRSGKATMAKVTVAVAAVLVALSIVGLVSLFRSL